MAPRLLTLLLPGLEGTGRLFDRFLAAGSELLEPRVVAYPTDRFEGYEALAARLAAALPADRPFALLGESFSGPLALRLAREAPPGLVGVVLAASFHRRPSATPISALRPLAPAFFRLPLPAHAVRLLLSGADAPGELVEEVRSAVALVKGNVMAARAREALRVDGTPWLQACPVPLLFLGGKQDHLLRSAIPIEVRALRPDAEIRMLEAPHLVLQTRPREAMRLVEQFLARAAASQPSARPSPRTPSTSTSTL